MEKTSPTPEINTVVTERQETKPIDDAVAVTPGSTPNVRLIAMQPFKIVLVRSARVYVQGLIGFLVAAGFGIVNQDGTPAGTMDAAKLATAPAVMSVLQNVAELLAKVDVNYPQTRA
jgi:hypothetical protein